VHLAQLPFVKLALLRDTAWPFAAVKVSQFRSVILLSCWFLAGNEAAT